MLDYWIKKLSGCQFDSILPTDFHISEKYNEESYNRVIDGKLFNLLSKVTRGQESSLFIFMLTTLKILIYKVTGKRDIVLLVPSLFSADKWVILRDNIDETSSFKELLYSVKETALEAYVNQDCPIEKLLERFCPHGYLGLLRIMIYMESTYKEFESKKYSNADIKIKILKETHKINFSISFNKAAYKKNTVEIFIDSMIMIMEQSIENVNLDIKDIDIVSDSDMELLSEFNNKIEYLDEKTIQQLFEEQVKKTPDNIAVVFDDYKLTYRELNEKANDLANIIRSQGIKSDSIVGIMVERSLEMVVGILGILKSGAAYLPIDLNYPKDRIDYMINDCNVTVLVTKKEYENKVNFNGKVINLSNDKLMNVENIDVINSAGNLAYVIYTSGTTGNPKGVLIEHKNIINTLLWRKKYYKFNENDTVMQIPSYSFDSSVEDILTPLISGSKLVIINNDDRLDLDYLKKTIILNKISHFLITPVFYNSLLDSGLSDINTLRIITVAGERIHESVITKHFNIFKNVRLINEYGPTENSVCSTVYEFDSKIDRVLIGKPINNTNIYILNSNNMMPIGIEGELCISGSGVSRGYLNKSELTNEKFVDNPFEEGKKMYRTGDLAKWLFDGNIEFIGRIDNQVKIRGYRVELGEIEEQLLKNKNIKEAVVIDKQDSQGNKYLCAYVVSYKEITVLELREGLSKKLPDYMIPSYFMRIEDIPLTPNGKIDKVALPEVDMNVGREYVAPTNRVEKKLQIIWSEILGIEKIGINDNFFVLGGYSLKGMMLVSKIHKELNKEVPLKELFKSPTIKGISKFIEEAEENIYSNIERIDEKEYYEASSAQKRMYIIQGFDKESIAYNMPQIFEIQGDIDKEKIEDTFRKLVSRHEALRTYFEVIDGEIVEKIYKIYEFKLEQEVSNQSIEERANHFVKPFDLGKAPLFRAEIVATQGQNYLLIDMHHIISDGVSMNILIKEFATLYNGANLEPLRLQYKDFAAWQNSFLKSEEIKKQEEYWINRFNGEIPILSLPYDYERPVTRSFGGDSISFDVDKDLAYKLKELAKNTGTTIHMVLLSAFNILLSKYSGQEDIIIGTPIAGRPHADLQKIMGMFVNTLALRNKPEGSKTYIDFLNEVKENSLKAYENQSYPIEKLVENLNLKMNPSRNPLFDVIFNTLNIDIEDSELNKLLLKPYNRQNNISKVDLELTLIESVDTLNLNLTYCNKLFNKHTIEIIINDFIEILKTITSDENIILGNIINNEWEDDLFELDNNLFLD